MSVWKELSLTVVEEWGLNMVGERLSVSPVEVETVMLIFMLVHFSVSTVVHTLESWIEVTNDRVSMDITVVLHHL